MRKYENLYISCSENHEKLQTLCGQSFHFASEVLGSLYLFCKQFSYLFL